MSLKTPLAVVANSVFGTWHLPKGLHLPDVRSGKSMLMLHRALTGMADISPLAWMRVGLMKGLKTVASFKNEPTAPSYTFFDDQGQEHKKPTRSIFFPGSGIDRNRNFNTGIRDLQCFMRAVLGQQSPELETGPIADKIKEAGLEETVAYLYQTPSKSQMLSSAWFNRLEHAYRLNVSPDYASDEARKFVEEVFMPEISTPSATGERTRIPTYDAANNMRFTLSGQSYGGTFCQMVINALYERMTGLGYRNSEIQTVFDNILVFNISGAAFATNRLDRPSPQTLFIEHEHDFVGFQTDRHDVHPYFKDSTPAFNKPIELSNNRFFYWLNFDWKTEAHPNGVEKPKEDVYGYHDLRGTLSALPEDVRNTLHVSLNPDTKRMPPLKTILNGNASSWKDTPTLALV